MKQKNPPLSELIHDEITKVKRNYNPIVGKVKNVIDHVWKNYELKPIIQTITLQEPKYTKKLQKLFYRYKPYSIETPAIWFLVIHLPDGIPFSEFKSHEEKFANAVGGSCYITSKGMAIHMTITNKRLANKYNYEFNPMDYPKLNHTWNIPIPIGVSVVDGVVIKDLASILNLFLIGIPGSGKSNALHSCAYSLLLQNKNRILKPKIIVAMVDLKIGEFKWIKKYGGIYARTPDETLTLFSQLIDENERRANVMEKSDSRKFIGWLKKGNYMPFIVIIVDELAKLANDCPEAFVLLQALASQGRSQGICIIGATQRASHSISKKVSFKDLQAMFEATLAMRVSDGISARMAMKDDRASKLDIIAGRAIFEWDISQEVQTYYFPDPDESKEDEDFFNSLLDNLDQIPEKYLFEEGEEKVHDIYSQKGILPRSTNFGTSGSKNMHGHQSNPFTYLSRS